MAQTSGRRAAGAQRGSAGRNEYSRTGRTNASYRSEYIAGNTARQLDITEEIQKPRKPEPSVAVRKNRDRAVYMNLGYVLFLAVSMLAAGMILIGYIRLQSDITASIKTISRKESELNSLRVANDEEISRIESAVDLEEIRRIAITELGMTYPDESQIVVIPDEGSDYVRQLADLE